MDAFFKIYFQNNKAFNKTILIFFFILLNLSVMEIALEVRAISRGNSGYLIELIKSQFSAEIKARRESISKRDIHSTRNYAIPNSREKNHTMRILILGSSSSADNRFSIDQIWPTHFMNNLNIYRNKYLHSLIKNDHIELYLVEEVKRKWREVEVINASWPGMSLPDSFHIMESIVKEYDPDVVLIYQMTNTINLIAKNIQEGLFTTDQFVTDRKFNNSTKTPPKPLSIINYGDLKTKLYITLGNTTIYQHLKAIIGMSVIQMLPNKKDYMPIIGEKIFIEYLKQYKQYCNEKDIQLILTTLSNPVNPFSDNKKINFYTQPFFRWNSFLSEKGWVNSVKNFNKTVISFGHKNTIPVLSVEDVMVGQYHLFTDFVHFSREGHERFGDLMAKAFIIEYILSNNPILLSQFYELQ